MSLEQRYDSGMTVKITISLPDELVEGARAAVEAKQATSVSAYIATAMRSFAERYTWDQYLADMEALDGPIPAEAYDWADQALRQVSSDEDPHAS